MLTGWVSVFFCYLCTPDSNSVMSQIACLFLQMCVECRSSRGAGAGAGAGDGGAAGGAAGGCGCGGGGGDGVGVGVAINN